MAGNCPSWSRCIKHVEIIHNLLDLNILEEALTHPKAHFDSLEERKARKCAIETRFQGQGTFNVFVGEFRRGSLEKKDAWRTWRAYALLRIFLCLWAPTQGL